ncbi:integral membrane sensor signal transduction histidine kinase [Acetonema longum DSM 6540]|uniref:histidine kinase n=1 Tax=Acetonema longum DSM 6540 TaxID=1009370 RepID=F7NP17_9FIRM|nr:integral membrane sensor signal transduction histidine kinase [Acetonema longum DSM 6540]
MFLFLAAGTYLMAIAHRPEPSGYMLPVAGFLVLSAMGSLLMANRAMIPIQHAWRRQQDFLAGASHELRTPLAVIQANLDIVRSNRGEAVSDQEHWLNNMQEESAHMAKIVDSLLFLARSGSRQQALNKQWFDLAQVLEAAVAEALQAMAEAGGVTLSIDAEAGIMLYGDAQRIQQLIGILADNAIRYTPWGGSIEIKAYRLLGLVVIEVTDSGEGISAEHLSRIFDGFYQTDPARAKGGAGLGLAMAKSIVDSHGGNIDASSKLGAGTTFIIRLPFS